MPFFALVNPYAFGGGTPPSGAPAPDLAYWTLDEGSGTAVGDSVGPHNGTLSGAAWVTGKISSSGPTFTEAWTGTDLDPWNATRWPTIETTGGLTVVDIQANGTSVGRMSPEGVAAETYVYARAMSSSANFTDLDLTIQFTLGTDGEQYHEVNFRHDGNWLEAASATPLNCYTAAIWDDITVGEVLRLYSIVGGSGTLLQSVAKTWGLGTWNLRIQAIETALKIKAWQGAEPATWDIEQTNGDHASGKISLTSTNGNATTARPISWDTLDVVEASNALDFDGINDTVVINTNTNLENLSDFTYTAWIFPTGSGDREIVVKRQHKEIRLLGTSPNIQLRGAVAHSGTLAEANSAAGTISLSTWQHVGVTFAGGAVKLYINGVEPSYAAGYPVAGGGSPTSDSSFPLTIGVRRQDGGSFNRFFDGIIDDVRIYSRALNATEMLAIYNEKS